MQNESTSPATSNVGTPMYMAPEVFDSEAYNEKADVFSFACIMSELFSRFILSTQVVGPTGNPNAAMVYAEKVAPPPLPYPPHHPSPQPADLSLELLGLSPVLSIGIQLEVTSRAATLEPRSVYPLEACSLSGTEERDGLGS